MNCLQFQKALQLAVDSEVVGELRATFAAHLDECATCRARMLQEHLVDQGIHHAAQKIATPRALRRNLQALAQKERLNEAQTHVLAPLALVCLLFLSFSLSHLYERSHVDGWPLGASNQQEFYRLACEELPQSLSDALILHDKKLVRFWDFLPPRFAVCPQTELRAVSGFSTVTDVPSFHGFTRGKGARNILTWSCRGRTFELRSPCASRNLAKAARSVCRARGAFGETAPRGPVRSFGFDS